MMAVIIIFFFMYIYIDKFTTLIFFENVLCIEYVKEYTLFFYENAILFVTEFDIINLI